MKEVRASAIINKPVNELFAFAIDPRNTPKWVKSITLEETNEWPIKAGSIYRNQRKNGEWSEYEVVTFEPNKTFVLKKDDGLYVEYGFVPAGESITRLEYCLRMATGELGSSLDERVLESMLRTLKMITERPPGRSIK